MEELKLLVGMVSDLPSMALWVIAFFFIYKVTILGSIYGVLKLAINRLYGYLTSKPETVSVDGFCISGTKEELLAELSRLRLRSESPYFHSSYLHLSDIDWLRGAIDDKLEKEGKKEAEKEANQ